ncbi:Uncharacterised protein [uncultured archaeon]|nr:Uncharacterised protein [uncultured archaeon]
MKALADVKNEVSQLIGKADTSDSFLIVVNSGYLQEVTADVVREFQERTTYGIYVSLNRPYFSVKKYLVERGVDVERVFFVDCITSAATNAQFINDANVFFAKHPEDIRPEGSILTSINRFIKATSGEKFIVVDALRTLLLHNDVEEVSQFVHHILSLTHGHRVKIVFLTLWEEDMEVIQRLGMAFDEIALVGSEDGYIVPLDID